LSDDAARGVWIVDTTPRWVRGGSTREQERERRYDASGRRRLCVIVPVPVPVPVRRAVEKVFKATPPLGRLPPCAPKPPHAPTELPPRPIKRPMDGRWQMNEGPTNNTVVVVVVVLLLLYLSY
jgi:hypothetical protein